MATTTATATAATYERNNSASSLSDDVKEEDTVVNIDNDAVTTATTPANVIYESILPPVTDEIKREYELEQQLKKDHHHSNDNDSDANDENDENSNSKHQQQQQQGNSNQGSGKQDCGGFKLLLSYTIWGIPTLMWILCLIFAITVIVYAIITATYYNPSIADDPVQPPYYSPGGTLYPTIYIEN